MSKPGLSISIAPAALAFALAVSLLATLLFVACGSDAPEEEAVLASLTDSIIVPGYVEVANESRELRAALEALCAAPGDGSLAGARQAWRDARRVWSRSRNRRGSAQ